MSTSGVVYYCAFKLILLRFIGALQSMNIIVAYSWRLPQKFTTMYARLIINKIHLICLRILCIMMLNKISKFSSKRRIQKRIIRKEIS